MDDVDAPSRLTREQYKQLIGGESGLTITIGHIDV